MQDIPKALLEFRKIFADIEVHVETLHSHQIVSSLLLKEADIGFVFGPSSHPCLAQTALGGADMMCVAPKGVLFESLVNRGWVGLDDLKSLAVVALDTRDPVGNMLNQACRGENIGQHSTLTVQTYHVALAMAENRIAVALVDSCTARSADLRKVNVLRLEPQIPVSFLALRHIEKPDSIIGRAVIEKMHEALMSA